MLSKIIIVCVLATVPFIGHAEASPEIRACLLQACGPEDGPNSYMTLARAPFKDPAALGIAHREAIVGVVASINQLIGNLDALVHLKLDYYDRLLQEPQLTFTTENLIIHNFIYVIKAFEDIEITLGDKPNEPYKIDREKTLKSLKDYTPAEQKWLIDTVDRFIKTPAGIDLVDKESMSSQKFLNKKFPSPSTAQSLKSSAEEVTRLRKVLTANQKAQPLILSSLWPTITDDALVERAKAGADLSEAEMEKMTKILTLTALVVDIVTDKMPFLDRAYPLKFSDYLIRHKARERVDEQRRAEADPEKMKAARKKAYDSCTDSFVFTLGTAPTADELRQANLSTEWAKDTVKAILQKQFSPATQQKLRFALDNSYFAFPSRAEEFAAYFKARLDSEAHESAEFTSFIKKNENKSFLRDSMLLDLHGEARELQLEKRYSDLTDICDKFKQKGPTDAAYTSTGRIITSWFTLKSPEAGRGVLLHELGHIAFAVLKKQDLPPADKKRFEEIKTCLSRKHPEIPKGISASHYADEDWSDLLAAKGLASVKKNLFCEFTGIWDTDSLIAKEVKDPHSENLFRILHVNGVQQGSMPASCQPVIPKIAKDVQFDSCL